jgi:Family of unknown function (DUF6176)
MKSNLYKIKEGRTDQWRDWCNQLATTRNAEAIETLAEEGVSQEMFLLFHYSNNDYVITVIDGDALPSNLDRQINRDHRRNFAECLEKVVNIELLYHIKAEEVIL